MRLKDLAPVLRSFRGYIQMAIIYDVEDDIDIETGCSVEYAIANYGERIVEHITAEESDLVLHTRKGE